MFAIVMTVFVLGFVLGFLFYQGCRVGVKEWKSLKM